MALDKSPQKREPLVADEMRHKRKHPQTSQSARRADHKHQYEKVIVQAFPAGWAWSKRCTVCGKMADKVAFSSSDFLLPECKNRVGLRDEYFYALEDIRVLYPGIPVYEFDKDLEWHLMEE